MMKKIIDSLRKIAGNFIGFILFYTFGRKIIGSKFNNDKILSIYFHNPSCSVFEQVIKWLVENNFKIITIEKFQECYDKKECKNKHTAFITFDDAWAQNLNLLPILEKYNIPITLFVAVEPVLDGQIWLNTVRANLHRLDPLKAKIVLSELKNMSFLETRKIYKACKDVSESKREIMTKEQLIAFSKKVTIGSHTISHPILTNCDDDIVLKELLSSEKILTNWGLNVNNIFAYPNGSVDDRVLSIIRKTNYKYAFTTEPSILNLNTSIDNFRIPRICIPDGFGKYENLARMSSAWSRFFKN